ncbi:MAG: hypothetical protein LBS48_05530 [Treponema sp.]|jgi:hypothetical protein|nr:hypothetical protein [Treponema sp.]
MNPAYNPYLAERRPQELAPGVFIVTDVSSAQGLNALLLLTGVEFKKEAYQTLGINIESCKDDPYNTANHQEIFDHNVKMNNAGRAIAADVWDYLLSRGRKIWGIASDDFHHCSRYGGDFIMVKAQEKSIAALLATIKTGSFYASSGIILKYIRLDAMGRISLAATTPRAGGTSFRFIGKNGKLLSERTVQEPGEPVMYQVQGDEGYVRVEALREDGVMAWISPFWIE